MPALICCVYPNYSSTLPFTARQSVSTKCECGYLFVLAVCVTLIVPSMMRRLGLCPKLRWSVLLTRLLEEGRKKTHFSSWCLSHWAGEGLPCQRRYVLSNVKGLDCWDHILIARKYRPAHITVCLIEERSTKYHRVVRSERISDVLICG